MAACIIQRDGNWEKLFDSWVAPEEKFPLKADRYCPICGANKPIELHETWCPNEPDRIAKDDPDFWLEDWSDEEADVCDAAYHAPERPEGEDWGLREACLSAVTVTTPGQYDVTYAIGHPPLVGIGGAPVRATTLPPTPSERKQYPVASGVLDYFPDALVAIANLSYVGNEQHNPGKPLHWDRSKSGDEADTLLRHFLERGTVDSDGIRHSVKMAWRALALLQKEIEQEGPK